ncbi:hypothetical protein K435DRAFT_964510 [Dendrothele bispora CBS 962.96]|uniref:Uncharacterized protein n=1 Tax=Dendrothele bispora (strain CBS 962.96) TaxID=1314807 RepID=A0A4S8MAL2_DENBC|nr:hypothetical protein K435DRAFT_964510 [Dendrothele bispora CBS 962.96]
MAKEDAFEDFDLITGLTFQLKNSMDTCLVRHPVVMPKNVYLFIAPVTLNRRPESGSTEVRWLTNGRDHYFLSFDPSGSTPLSRRISDILGLPNYRTDVELEGSISFNYQHKAAKYLQEIQGFDPLTQDYARARGLPLFEWLSSLEHFHPNVIDLTEEGQEVWDVWSETSSNMSDSESVYGDAGSQLQSFQFPIPSPKQELNGTTPDISDDSDLGNFEEDFSLDEESDDSASHAFGLNSSSESALTKGCKPSSWLRAYLIQEDVESWTGERDRNEFCWRFTSSVSDTDAQEIYTFRRICECLHMGRHQQRIGVVYGDEWCSKCGSGRWRNSYMQVRKRRASI